MNSYHHTSVSESYTDGITFNALRIDRVFRYLLPIQWLFAIICAAVISPLTWKGEFAQIHPHVIAAVFLGGVVTAFPVYLTYTSPGAMYTRLIISVAQSVFSILFIFLFGGRIEAHFHVFVSLAFLSAYADNKVLLPAISITLVDHLVRGYLWPRSVYGDSAAMAWRAFEHVAWVLFEAVSLGIIIHLRKQQNLELAELQLALSNERDRLEDRVRSRTSELSEAKEFQSQIVNSIDAYVCVLSRDYEILFANNKFHDALRSHTSKSRIKLLPGFFAPCSGIYSDNPEAQTFDDSVRNIIEGASSTFMGEYTCTIDGSAKMFQIQVRKVPYNGRTSVAITHVDITTIRQAQSRVSSLAKLVLDSPNEVYVFNPEDLRFVEVNKGATENLKLKKSELLSKSFGDVVADFSLEEFRERTKPILNRQREVVEFHAHLERSDGTKYEASVSLHQGKFDQEDVFVAFVTDLTEHRQLEEKLAEARKLESLGQLAAGIAHEINTPMQCVFGNVEFLHDSIDRLFSVTDAFTELLKEHAIDWEVEREKLNAIRSQYRYDFVRKQIPLAIDEATEASRRVISIVRAMKVMSHPGTAEKVSTDINDLLQNSAVITRNRWKYVADVEFDLDPNLGTILALPAELSQVFINLIVNAADAIDSHNGDEPATLGKILLTTRMSDGFVIIMVKDSGCGMTEDVRRRIFDPFFTTKEVGKGTGQGLAITYDVVINKHGGGIEVRTAPGRGSEFILTFPIREFSEMTSPAIMPSTEILSVSDSSHTIN